jgi:hypothetical protein
MGNASSNAEATDCWRRAPEESGSLARIALGREHFFINTEKS